MSSWLRRVLGPAIRGVDSIADLGARCAESLVDFVDIIGTGWTEGPLAAPLGLARGLRRLRRTRTKVGESIDEVQRALENAQMFIADLEREVSERAEEVQELRELHQRYESLSEISHTQADALRAELDDLLKSRQRGDWLRGIVISVIVGLLLLVVGYFLHPVIKPLVDSLGW